MRDNKNGRLPKSWPTIALVVVLGIAIGLTASPVAADRKYIRVDELKGNVKQQDHVDWSFLNAYTHIINKPGKVPACKVIVEKPIDPISPALWMAAISGQILEEVEVHFMSLDQLPQKYFISFMKMVTIKKVKSMGADDEDGGDITQDRIVLLPESLNLTYIIYDANGYPINTIVEELTCSD